MEDKNHKEELFREGVELNLTEFVIQKYVEETREYSYYKADGYNSKGREIPLFTTNILKAKKNDSKKAFENIIKCWALAVKFKEIELDLSELSVTKIRTDGYLFIYNNKYIKEEENK